MTHSVLQHRRKHFRTFDTTADLVAEWHLEEESGDLIDSTGRGNDLTRNFSILRDAGKVNWAQAITSATSSRMSHVDTADLRFIDDFTFCAWLRLDGEPGGDIITIAAKRAVSPPNEFDFFLQSDQLVVEVPGAYARGDIPGGIVPGTWRHFGVTCELGSTPKLYVDAIEIEAETYGGLTADGGGDDFILGFSSFACTYRLDEAAKWARALRAAEMGDVYNNGLP